MYSNYGISSDITALCTMLRREQEESVVTMKNITKKDLVEQIADRTGLTRVDTKIIVECFLDSISQALQDGTNIEIRKFGRFKTKKKNARRARNPRTNEYIDVASGYKPVFEASKELRKRINDAVGLKPTSPVVPS